MRPATWLGLVVAVVVATALAMQLGCRPLPRQRAPVPEPKATGERAVSGVRPPNIVLLMTDDQGYGDLSCYGNPTIHTPNIDAMAARGLRFSQFYVPSPLCSPTRAGLLTGCYPKRVGMHRHVIFPEYDYGLHTDEVTIADLLKARGYATCCVGKWHLGHRLGLLPTDQGFDEYYGLPYSNDMSQYHRRPNNRYRYRLPLMRGTEVVEWEPDQHRLTKNATAYALDFIDRHADEPFFLYMPYSMPHIPIYASAEFAGRSPRGLYGDVIEEIDASVGDILARLASHGLTERTLVVFLSDNGPWLSFKERGGSAGPLRGGKGTNFEGGQRVPCIAQWPGCIAPASVSRSLATAMDWLPTIAALTSSPLPERKIDGVDLSPTFLRDGPGTREAVREFLYYSAKGELAGIRRGGWKLLLKSGELYDVEVDISEEWNRADRNESLVAELRERAAALDAEIERNARPVRHVPEQRFDPKKP